MGRCERPWRRWLCACAAALLCACGGQGGAPRDGASDAARDVGGDAARDAAAGDAAQADAAPDGAGGDAPADDAVGDAATDDAGGDAAEDATPGDAAPDGAGGDAATDAGGDAAFSGVFDVRIFVANTCDVTTTPASITVPAGTEFTVNWINLGTSASNVDVDKVDQYNQVPIIIGLEPGQSHHDTVREWCGTLFTGTFDFRITGCYDPYYLPVDCGG